ncbi:pilus assembly protein [Actinocrinis puniceicyclus]|uniref:Pilus assembly protein n=1 Tax=Actinocrinis puniceicyclus TaxID=977794 RepID=A0A8J7WKV6_9ACTN|nr:TadE family protein [Actinocrinis puniceicyclus]MBS2961977.1 pilus assembly protein [Actinocrinis puniceicyclus]
MRRPGGAARRRAGSERGVSAIEFVLLTPVLFFLLFATVQFALYFFARHVAIAAAQEGDRVAREERANPNEDWSGDAVAKANGWVDQLASGLVGDSRVQPPGESGTPGTATWTVSVTVTATVHSLWGDMSVTETSAGPVEQFVQDPTN